MPNLKTWFDDTLSLLYPRLCLLCNGQVHKGDHLCISCEMKLPETDQFEMSENDFTEKFYGRLKIEFGAAHYLFGGGSKTQELIHAIKYKNKRELAVHMGKMYGLKLKESDVFPKIDFIIPIPLHPIKFHQRGFNQSEAIGKGLSEALNIPQVLDVLLRNKMTSTQTKKSRYARMENVGDAFCVEHPEKIQGKHILLIDDVITTGATLEACALTILEIVPDVKISMVTLATGE